MARRRRRKPIGDDLVDQIQDALDKGLGAVPDNHPVEAQRRQSCRYRPDGVELVDQRRRAGPADPT